MGRHERFLVRGDIQVEDRLLTAAKEDGLHSSGIRTRTPAAGWCGFRRP